MPLRASHAARLERIWLGEPAGIDHLLALGLRPAAEIFRGAAALRNLWWRWQASEPGVPVISVGNLTVGGNAKTPFTIFVANRLSARGLRVAIVSRGYNRDGAAASARAAMVSDGGAMLLDAAAAGDEPAMMARRFNGPIAIARRRRDAIELLRARGPLDAVILDDGFQHIRLARAADLVLISRERGFGNGRMLPAGPMREPIAALRRAAATVIVTANASQPGALSASELARIERGRVFHAAVRPVSLVSAAGGNWSPSPPSLTGRRVLAVSGLADPAGFHAMLRELEAELVGVLDFPDHHAYTAADWQEIAAAGRAADIIVSTEKDLVKLERFPFARDSLYALRVEVTMADADACALDELLVARIGARAAAAQEVSRDAR
ncbi:MAG TPA: tetraacyldisaccharide 4'-kinase [Candidatus Binataceae bacterium]|nr:tetraacyldisaccharide 4'-kinase [Candidatus Binataceae bacterium]